MRPIDNLDPPTICDNCIHDEVCGLEGHLEPACTYCCWKEERRSQGEWQVKDGLREGCYTCSNCGEISCCKGNFCPDCGAKMEGEEN